MCTNPRLRLPYDPHTGEVWKYYGVIKVIPIVMDKMLVILMTIPVERSQNTVLLASTQAVYKAPDPTHANSTDKPCIIGGESSL